MHLCIIRTNHHGFTNEVCVCAHHRVWLVVFGYEKVVLENTSNNLPRDPILMQEHVLAMSVQEKDTMCLAIMNFHIEGMCAIYVFIESIVSMCE